MPIQFPVCVLWASLSSWIWIQRCIHGAIYYRDVKILVMHKCEQVCQQVEVMTGNRTMNNNAQLYIISLAFMWKPFVWKHEYRLRMYKVLFFKFRCHWCKGSISFNCQLKNMLSDSHWHYHIVATNWRYLITCYFREFRNVKTSWN